MDSLVSALLNASLDAFLNLFLSLTSFSADRLLSFAALRTRVGRLRPRFCLFCFFCLFCLFCVFCELGLEDAFLEEEEDAFLEEEEDAFLEEEDAFLEEEDFLEEEEEERVGLFLAVFVDIVEMREKGVRCLPYGPMHLSSCQNATGTW